MLECISINRLILKEEKDFVQKRKVILSKFEVAKMEIQKVRSEESQYSIK